MIDRPRTWDDAIKVPVDRDTKQDDHPTVRKHRARDGDEPSVTELDANWLRELCAEAGADDLMDDGDD